MKKIINNLAFAFSEYSRKRLKCKLSKKAQIGATLTWFAAFVIVFFIMILFVFFCAVLAGEKKIGSVMSFDTLADKGSLNIQDISSLKGSLILLLNSPADKEQSFYEFLSGLNVQEEKQEDIKLFEEQTKKFVEDNLNVGEGNIYYRSWIRVYPIGEEISQYFGGKFQKALFSHGGSGGIDCDPLEKDATFIVIPIIPNKKIAICGNI